MNSYPLTNEENFTFLIRSAQGGSGTPTQRLREIKLLAK